MCEYCPWCDMPVALLDIDMEEIKPNEPEAMPPRIPLDVWFPSLKRLPD